MISFTSRFNRFVSSFSSSFFLFAFNYASWRSLYFGFRLLSSSLQWGRTVPVRSVRYSLTCSNVFGESQLSIDEATGDGVRTKSKELKFGLYKLSLGVLGGVETTITLARLRDSVCFSSEDILIGEYSIFTINCVYFSILDSAFRPCFSRFLHIGCTSQFRNLNRGTYQQQIAITQQLYFESLVQKWI